MEVCFLETSQEVKPLESFLGQRSGIDGPSHILVDVNSEGFEALHDLYSLAVGADGASASLSPGSSPSSLLC